MPLRRKRGAGVALRVPAGDSGGTPRGARPVTPVDDEAPSAPTRAPSAPARRRWPVILASLGAVVILAGAVAFTWWRAGENSSGSGTVAAPAAGDARSVLIVVEGDDRRATGVALFVSDGREDPRLLVAPPSLTMQIPGYGDGTLQQASAIEDAGLVRLALMNELGVRIDETITLGPGDPAALIGEPVRIDLPNAFIVETAQGNVVSASAGSDVFVPETAETLLVNPGADTPLGWLQRQRAVWEAIAAQIGAVPAPAVAVAPGFESIAEALGSAVVSVLPVDRVGVGISEQYVVSRNSELLNERLAFLALSTAVRPRVEILNATTLPAVTRPLAELLIESGFRVIKTGNAEERFRPDTLIIAQGIPNQQAALDTQTLLGAGDVVVDSAGSGVVDVSIIVGRDIATR